MKKISNKGFTMIELLGVVVILGILLLVALPAITMVTTNSRKELYLDAVRIHKSGLEKIINSEEYDVFDPDVVYYFDYRLTVENNEGQSPFGDWKEAYVAVIYDEATEKNKYYWTGIDIAGWTIDFQNPKEVKDLKKSDIYNKRKGSSSLGAGIMNRNKIQIYSYNPTTGATEISSIMEPYFNVEMEEIEDCYTLELQGEGTSATYSVIDYKKSCGPNVVIPSRVDGIKVTDIGENAFRGKGIESVTFYNGIVKIGNGAFQSNNIKTLSLPSSVKVIDSYAFYSNTKLTNLELPEGLETIGVHAFTSNALTYVVFPTTLKSIGSYAFLSNKLVGFELQSSPTLGTGAFANNKLPDGKGLIYKRNADGTTDYSTVVAYAGSNKNLNIPEMVNGVPLRTIAAAAFANSYLTSVTIPNTVTTIGNSAFYANSLKQIVIPEGVTSIGSDAFRSNLLTSIVIPSSVTSIGNYAFVSNCMPEGQDLIYGRNTDGTIDYSKIVSSSGGKNSANCPGSTKLIIPAEVNGVKLKTIVGSAFTYSAYKEFVLPDLEDTDHLTVGVNAFKNNAVSTVEAGMMYKIENGQYDYTTLDSYAGPRSGNITLPATKNGKDLKTIRASFSWGSYTSITIPSSVTTINSNVFQKGNTNNTALVKIINKTGREFNWYSITSSSHTNPGKFKVGTVSHQSGDIEITDN